MRSHSRSVLQAAESSGGGKGPSRDAASEINRVQGCDLVQPNRANRNRGAHRVVCCSERSRAEGEAAMAGKRELINTGTDKRYVRRNEKGQFKDVVDVGKSLAADRRKKAKTSVKSGQGDRGDRRR